MTRSFARFTLLANAAILVAPLLAGQAHAQAGATAAANSSTTIIQPIAIAKTSDLQFGVVAKGTTGSNTVTVDEADGSISISGGGDAGLTPSTTSRAAYTVTGEEGNSFSIALESSTITLLSGTDELEVALQASAANGTLADGEANFGVGGSFEIDSTTPAGAYTGTFDVTVAYN